MLWITTLKSNATPQRWWNAMNLNQINWIFCILHRSKSMSSQTWILDMQHLFKHDKGRKPYPGVSQSALMMDKFKGLSTIHQSSITGQVYSITKFMLRDKNREINHQPPSAGLPGLWPQTTPWELKKKLSAYDGPRSCTLGKYNCTDLWVDSAGPLLATVVFTAVLEEPGGGKQK